MKLLSILFNNNTLAEVNDDFTILWILISGILVFFMQAGFTLLESGMTRDKNAINIAMKNFMDISVATITFWAIGYGLMYGAKTGGFISLGSDVWFNPGAGAHDVFFQLVFAATAATIVSGAVAGRTKYSTYIIFTVFMTAIIYPISGGWQWYGDGAWLADRGFIDFAGSSIVHAVGGVAALVAACMVGPRIGKFGKDGSVNPIPGSNLLLATLGVFILWLGWFGFNGGSELKVSEVSSATAVSQVFLNTNMAAAGGVVAALLLSLALTGKMDVTMAINGAIAGLVSITADPLSPSGGTSVIVGAIGGIIVYFSILFLEKRGIDDPVGAISAHGIVGIYGVLVVSLTGGADFLGQLTGVVMIAAFTYVASYGVVKLINMVMPIRATDEEQDAGLDISEVGIEAYPEFD